jgi:hypothetical protein
VAWRPRLPLPAIELVLDLLPLDPILELNPLLLLILLLQPPAKVIAKPLL